MSTGLVWTIGVILTILLAASSLISNPNLQAVLLIAVIIGFWVVTVIGVVGYLHSKRPGDK